MDWLWWAARLSPSMGRPHKPFASPWEPPGTALNCPRRCTFLPRLLSPPPGRSRSFRNQQNSAGLHLNLGLHLTGRSCRKPVAAAAPTSARSLAVKCSVDFSPFGRGSWSESCPVDVRHVPAAKTICVSSSTGAGERLDCRVLSVHIQLLQDHRRRAWHAISRQGNSCSSAIRNIQFDRGAER
jgi:hypothetical protein